MSYSPSRSEAELRSSADALLLQLELPPAPELCDIVARVATLTGKRIEIEPVGDKDWESVTGLVLQTPTTATVLIRKSDPRWYQFHTVLHELSHVLYAHPGCATLPVRHPGRRHQHEGQTVLARGVTSTNFEAGIDFFDVDTVMEAEAEKLSQLLSRVVLEPRDSRDEAVFA